MSTQDLILKLNSNVEFKEKLKYYSISLEDFNDENWTSIDNNNQIFINSGFNQFNEKVILLYTQKNVAEVINYIFDNIKNSLLKESIIMCVIMTENDLSDVELSFIDTKHVKL